MTTKAASTIMCVIWLQGAKTISWDLAVEAVSINSKWNSKRENVGKGEMKFCRKGVSLSVFLTEEIDIEEQGELVMIKERNAVDREQRNGFHCTVSSTKGEQDQ